jgi:hypothetical protein
MPDRVYHHSWSGMKGAFKPRRKWMTWGEFDESLRILGVRVSRFKVRDILAHDPPAKQSGGLQYEVRHLQIVTDWARTEGLLMTDEQKREAIDAQDEAIQGIRRVCEQYQAGGTTFRLAKQAIEELMDQPSRIVRVGSQHTPEVQS